MSRTGLVLNRNAEIVLSCEKIFTPHEYSKLFIYIYIQGGLMETFRISNQNLSMSIFDLRGN